MAEPCGKTVPKTILNTVAFFEQTCEVPAGSRLSKDPAVQNFFEELQVHGDWKTVPTSEASRYLVVIAVSWEKLVLDRDAKAYVRVYACFKLVRLWSAMRWATLWVLCRTPSSTLGGEASRERSTSLRLQVEG